jgi:hypothetical protein
LLFHRSNPFLNHSRFSDPMACIRQYTKCAAY